MWLVYLCIVSNGIKTSLVMSCGMGPLLCKAKLDEDIENLIGVPCIEVVLCSCDKSSLAV